MLKKATIQNFQSHDDSILEFVPGVNVIIGKSDNGKSSILRAIRWLCINRPGGESFCSYWGGETRVDLKLEDHKIVRLKDKGNNEYLILPDKSSFKAFGTSVPEEILKILNLNELNLQSQLSSHFLLSNSPGEVAQYFNSIANLEIIDISQKNLKSSIKKLNSNIDYYTEDIDKKEKEMERFDYLEKFEVDLEILEGMEKQLIKKYSNKAELSSLINSIEKLDLDIKEQEKMANLEGKVANLISIQSKLEEKETERIKLMKLIREIQTNQQDLDFEIDRLKKLETKFHDNFPEICPLCGK